MTLKEAFIDAEFDKGLIESVCCPNAQLIVKRLNQHPCDPPIGEVVSIKRNTVEETIEILIS